MFEIFDNAADNKGEHSSLSKSSSQTEQTQKKGFSQRGVQRHEENFDGTPVELGEAQINMRERFYCFLSIGFCCVICYTLPPYYQFLRNNIIRSDKVENKLIGLNCIWEKLGTVHHLANSILTVKHGGDSIMLWGFFSAAGIWKKY